MREGVTRTTRDNLDVKMCDLCGLYRDELIMARLVLVSNQIVDLYLCEDCFLGIRKRVNSRKKHPVL